MHTRTHSFVLRSSRDSLNTQLCSQDSTRDTEIPGLASPPWKSPVSSEEQKNVLPEGEDSSRASRHLCWEEMATASVLSESRCKPGSHPPAHLKAREGAALKNSVIGLSYNRTWCTVRVQKVVAKLKTCSVNTESWLRSTWTKHTCKLRSKLTQTRRGGGLTASITGLVTDTEAQRAGPGACAAKGCFLPTYLFFYRYFLHDPRRILKGKESGYL